MFDLNNFTPASIHFFHQGPSVWPEAVLAAVSGGTNDTDRLTDLAFYMHHPDLMDGTVGRTLIPGMEDFDALAGHWTQLRDQVQFVIFENSEDQPIAPDEDWDLPQEVQRGIKAVAGQAGLDWALEPPTSPRMSKEFRPARRFRKEMEAVLLWKSPNPDGTCLARRTDRRSKRIQILKLWSTDLEYWREQTSTEQTAQMRHTANVVSAREYRNLIISRKICPAKAIEIQQDDQRELHWDLFVGAFSFLSPFPVQGGPLVNSLGDLLARIAAIIEEGQD